MESFTNIDGVFRLLYLKILNHKILGNLELDLDQNDFNSDKHDELDNNIFTSVVIGANGIGKSYLLRSISDIFCYLENLHSEITPNPPSFHFLLRYCIDSSIFEFSYQSVSNIKNGKFNFSNTYSFKKNGSDVSVRDMILPSKVVAISTTITDKFLAKSTSMYRYKGLRSENIPSRTGTRTMVRKTVDSILDSLISKTGFRQELMDLLKHLGLLPRLELTYSIKYKDIFVSENITVSVLQDIFKNQKKYFNRNSQLWGTKNFEKIERESSDKLDVVVSFLRSLAGNSRNNSNGKIRYDLLDEETAVTRDREALRILSLIDLLSYPSLNVYKNNDFYSYEQSSSGESILLCQMVSIMSEIYPNSLILIDEPEASSHPNWQISYIDWLKSIFKSYFSCHFIISTHSHFLLSNLSPKSSNIIALRKEIDCIFDIGRGINTYCWSADDILYHVFGVRNTRNAAFEEDIMTLLKMISNGNSDIVVIKDLICKLEKFILPGNDPLKQVLIQAKKYVENR